MSLETIVVNELIENQGRDKAAAKINGKRIIDLVGPTQSPVSLKKMVG